ncbi:MAG TPA: type ISP restriction/modification enzyme [Ktedonobacteraceae bacterium]|jgi:predicted helicase
MSETVLRAYLSEIEKYYRSGKATEYTYRGTLRELLEKLDRSITATNEPKRIKCGAPDYVVERNNLTIGYIEAKDVNTSLDKIEKDEQLGRYRRALENLILTDYVEFRWYIQGEKCMTARLASPCADKRLQMDKQEAVEVQQLLQCFLEHNAEPIRKPQDLAKRMARLAHMIRDVIIHAFKEREASDNLRDLYEAFQEVLLPELSRVAFADMFAQTLAYGLFAARYNHASGKLFNRGDATKEIPRTNPFLRKLFGTIAGPDLDDEPFVGFVDELAQILAYTDMDAVLADFGKATRQEDPIVHFYETFLAQYDPNLKELRGVYYTPEPVVSYIVRSVDHLLRKHFNCPDGLADTGTVSYTYEDETGEKHEKQSQRVLILDPATGTGTFLYRVVQHIRENYRAMGNAGMWSAYVREHLLPRIFGFELLMAPYAMAHLKLGMQLAAIDLPKEERTNWSYDFNVNERLGIYLTNTLDEAHKRSEVLFGRYISDEANEASRVKQGYPVMIVLGNPPYSNFGMLNKGKWILDLLEDYKKDLHEKKLNLDNDFIKFMRFAQWRIEQTGYGIVAFITSNTYIDGITHRRMRKSLMETFTDIYILDLHGNSKKKEKSPDGTRDENVFDIQEGVAIGIFVKRQGQRGLAKVHHAEFWGTRENKYARLLEEDVDRTGWKSLDNIEHKSCLGTFYFFTPKAFDNIDEYCSGWNIKDIFPVQQNGIKTDRDKLFLDFDRDVLENRIKTFYSEAALVSPFKEEYQIENSSGYDLLSRRQKTHFDAKNIRPFLYRPFDQRMLYYAPGLTSRPAWAVMSHMISGKNIGLIATRQTRDRWGVLATRGICGHKSLAAYDINSLFPLYLYPENKEKGLFENDALSLDVRYPNLSPAFVAAVSNKLKMPFVKADSGDLQYTFGPEDVFYYMYAIFHSSTYQQRYAEFLSIDFPRLPLTSNTDLFRTLRNLGNRLSTFHLMEKTINAGLQFPISGTNMIEKIEYTCNANKPNQGRIWINKEQYFEGMLPEVWEFYVGGYQVCQRWLKDREGRLFTHKDFQDYQRIVSALTETIDLAKQINEVIEKYGGWPIE